MLNVPGKEPRISYSSIPTEYADPEGFHDSSHKPKHQASSILSSGSSPMEVLGSVVPTLCLNCAGYV